MSTLEQTRRLEPGSLPGTWSNTDRTTTTGLTRLSVTGRGGRLRVHVAGPGGDDWGATVAQARPHTTGETTAWAFTATLRRGGGTVALSAYVKTGILVLTTYRRTAGDQPPVFTREFFHRTGPATDRPATDRPATDRPGAGDVGDDAGWIPWVDRDTSRSVDVRPLATTWLNFDEHATTIARIELRATPAGGLVAVPFGPAGRHPRGDLTDAFAGGETALPAVPFVDGEVSSLPSFPPAVAFLSEGHGADDADAYVRMAAYVNRRLLTVETATGWRRTPDAPGFFIREHFHPSLP